MARTICRVIRRARWSLGYGAVALTLALIALAEVLTSGAWDDCAGASTGGAEGISFVLLLFAFAASIACVLTSPMTVAGWKPRLRAFTVALIPLAAVIGVVLVYAGHPAYTCRGG
jgi:hypothetical protein